MAETITTCILNYINHLEDTEYLATIVTSASRRELSNIISELLCSNNQETVNLTCLFIRDLVLFGSRHHACQEFVESYPESLIVQTLESLLFSVNYFIREQVVYTLGKTCSYKSVYALCQAFNALQDSDPLLIPRFIGEIAWLGAENIWELVENITTRQGYLTRWAVIEALSQFGHDAQTQDEIFQIKRKCFEQLRQDANILVKLEAEYEYQLLEFDLEAHTMAKAERKKKQKKLKQRKPALCFDTIRLAFGRHLYSNGSYQYSVDELEAFVEAMNITPVLPVQEFN